MQFTKTDNPAKIYKLRYFIHGNPACMGISGPDVQEVITDDMLPDGVHIVNSLSHRDNIMLAGAYCCQQLKDYLLSLTGESGEKIFSDYSPEQEFLA